MGEPEQDQTGKIGRTLRDEGFHRFVSKGLWPLLTILSTLTAARIQQYRHTGEVEKKVEKVEKKAVAVSNESVEETKRAWRGLAKPANNLADQVTAANARIEALEATTKAQSALIVAIQRDFVVEGKPATRRVDAGLVKAVRDNAAKNSRELLARSQKPVPVLARIPLELPPAPPKTAPLSTVAPPPAAAPAPPVVTPASQDGASVAKP